MSTLLKRLEHSLLVWLTPLTLCVGVLFLFLIPPWQHYDEPTHFEYAWLIANRPDKLADQAVDSTMRRETAASMVVHDFYTPPLQPPNLLSDAQPLSIGILELHHPPLYYRIVALPLRLVRHLDVVSQLRVARLVSLLMFVGTVLASAAFIRLLTPEHHPLRWLVPVGVLLTPPFPDIMTAVNNDVGAIFVLTLFIWATSAFFTEHVNVWHIVAAIAFAAAAFYTKSTAFVALPFLLLASVMAWWGRRGWRWRWLALLGGMAGIATAALVFTTGDAAHWHRLRYTIPNQSTAGLRDTTVNAPLGSAALRIDLKPGAQVSLLNPIVSEERIQALRGRTVTIGAFMWASEPARVKMPTLAWSPAGSIQLHTLPAEAVDVSTEPRFYAWTTTVPEGAARLHYVIQQSGARNTPPLTLWLDGMVLVEGQFPSTITPQFLDETAQRGVWGDTPFENLIRNGSAEAAWPRLRPAIEEWLTARQYYPGTALGMLFDVRTSSTLIITQVLPFLLHAYMGRFAWGHITIEGTLWRWLIFAWFGLSSLSGIWWWIRQPNTLRKAVLLYAGLVGAGIWGIALVWPLQYQFLGVFSMPAPRYVYPAITISTLLLTGSWAWWLHSQRSIHRWWLVPLLLYGTFFILGIHSLVSYY
ncbi:MAG: DUF2142 domain-containing protein [Ardenticatenia bacterium]|nr:MAG: DUF2142 domain-containing protein [Ardenticatenia bacterium]